MTELTYKTFGAENNVFKLIVFLHGYNSCIGDVEPFAEMLANKLENTLIVVPEAEMVCERNPQKKQWYALTDVDPERRRRKPETPTDEIIAIYNRTGQRISMAAKEINRFISKLQKLYGVRNKNTYIMGFSQGAMLAIFAGLTRRYKLGGVFPFAGIVCGKDVLEKEISSRPDVYLFHGTSDLAVQYKTLSFTKEWLETHGICWEAVEYDGIEHRLIEDEMEDAAEIIKRSA
ncbi:MAG: alpha/beta hydrolase [Acetobacter sp.]|nr:alpha/beta hydrolase [Acetobacter sp.]